MPRRILIGLLALAPALSLINLWAWRVLSGGTPAAQAHFLLAFVVAPLLTIGALLVRSKAALVIYPLLGVALATFPGAATAASVAAVVMTASGSLLVSYELLVRNVRYRRRAMRYFIQRKIALLDANERHPAVLRDCSQVGLGVSVSSEHAGAFIRGLDKGHAVDVEIGSGAVRGLLMWRRESGQVINVGLVVEPCPALEALLAQCRVDPLVMKAGRLESLLRRRPILAALGILWVFAALLAYALPTFL